MIHIAYYIPYIVSGMLYIHIKPEEELEFEAPMPRTLPSLRLEKMLQISTCETRKFEALKLRNVGAQTITNTFVGAPYFNYSIMGPKTLF